MVISQLGVIVTKYKELVVPNINAKVLVVLTLLSLLLLAIVGSEIAVVEDNKNKSISVYRGNVESILELKADQIASWRSERLKDIQNVSKNILEEPFISYANAPENYVYRDLVDMVFSPIFVNNVFTDILLLDSNFNQLGTVRTKYEIYTQLLETYKATPITEDDSFSIVDLSKEIDGSVHMAVAYYHKVNTKHFHSLFIINPETQLYPLLQKVPLTLGDTIPALFKVYYDKVVILTKYKVNIPDFESYRLVPNSKSPFVYSALAILDKNKVSSIIDVNDDIGRESIIAYAPIRESLWYVSMIIPKNEGYATILNTAFLTNIVLIASIFLWFAGIFLISWRYRLFHLYNITEKLKQYKVLVDESPDIMYERSSIHGYTFYSPTLKKVLGYHPEQLLNKEFSTLSLIHHEDIEVVSTAYIDALETNQLNVEYRVKDINGEWKWILDRSISIDLGELDGEFIIKGVMSDITTKKSYENLLKLAATTFANVLEAMVITNPDGKVLEINDAFTRITGYSREEIKGLPISILKSGIQAPYFYTQMFKALAEHGYWQGELWNKRKDGSLYFEKLVITALRNTSGEVSSYLGLFLAKL